MSDEAPSVSLGRGEELIEEASRLRLGIARLQRRIRIDSGDSPLQLAVLSTIELHGALRVSELAKIEAVSVATMSRVVTALCEKALVERTADPLDGRGKLVALSHVGRARLQETRSLRTTLVARRLSRLDEEHRAAIRAALPAIESLLNE
ncbi:MarR family winged helix-turn-helix transcriptional regulator [Pseudonocardia oroxyli]|uniref:MarR family winged helix-turn-helix transcriptional regulator n=1 Tax=Pseudonocardia oroxyli TaxID=366584 RepID=UPI000B8420F6|nr:MarR family transcriptional regulator [Pseudonocardia oroxyli]